MEQASGQWFAKIDSYLCEELHFQSSEYDPCFCGRKDRTKILTITLFVDDVTTPGSSAMFVLQLKFLFCKHFEIADVDEAQVCLGIETIRKSKAPVLNYSQAQYAIKVLQQFGM